MAPSKEAMEAALRLLDDLRWPVEAGASAKIALALDAYATKHADGYFKALAAERDAALARTEAAEAERDNIAREALQAVVARQRAEERVRVLEVALRERVLDWYRGRLTLRPRWIVLTMRSLGPLPTTAREGRNDDQR